MTVSLWLLEVVFSALLGMLASIVVAVEEDTGLSVVVDTVSSIVPLELVLSLPLLLVPLLALDLVLSMPLMLMPRLLALLLALELVLSMPLLIPLLLLVDE